MGYFGRLWPCACPVIREACGPGPLEDLGVLDCVPLLIKSYGSLTVEPVAKEGLALAREASSLVMAWPLSPIFV